MANRSVYSVTKTENTFSATRVDDEDAFDAFDDFDNIVEEVKPEVVEQPKQVKEEEVKKEEVIPENEEEPLIEEKPKGEEKQTNKAGWSFEDFEGSGSIKPKIYASAAGGSNVVVKKQPPKQVKTTKSSSSSKVDWDKYKNAKSISSDQMFGSDEPSAYEKQKLSQNKNANAIGSEDFFGKEEKKSYSSIKDKDDDWGNDDLAKMADSIANGAARLASKAKSLFDDF